MIGGQDIRLKTPSGPQGLDLAVRAARLRWPSAVFVVDGRPEVVTRYERVSFHANSEVIVYRDQAACDAWREIGYDDSLRGTSIYLIADDESLTMAVEEDPPAETRALIGAIEAGVASLLRRCIISTRDAA